MQQLRVQIDSATDDDTALLEQLTQGLRSEIEELEVDAVELSDAGSPPPMSKSGSGTNWGQLLVTLANPGAILANVIKAIDSWIKTQDGRSVTVEIDGDRLELTGVSTEDQKAVIQHWIQRHRG